MLGHMLINRLQEYSNFDIFDITRNSSGRKNNYSCDITDLNLLQTLIIKIKPSFIVNCIGVLIKGSLEDPSNAIFINSYLPHKLANFSDSIGAKLIHISTDCVFDGLKGSYVETDLKTAQDVYGMSKSLGEINNSGHLTLRTSIIGPELKENGEGLLSWVLKQKGEINGFKESIWGGVTTLVLSDIIIKSIANQYSGLIHVTNGKSISKYNLLDLIQRYFVLKDISIVEVPGKYSDKSLNTLFNYFNIPTCITSA